MRTACAAGSILTHLPPSPKQVYSFWIFDRHCSPIYHQDWSQLHIAPPSSALPLQFQNAVASLQGGVVGRGQGAQGGMGEEGEGRGKGGGGGGGGADRFAGSVLPRVTRSVGGASVGAIAAGGSGTVGEGSAHRQSAGSVVSGSVDGAPGSAAAPVPATTPGNGTGSGSALGRGTNALPFDEEAKLVYGVVFSLRNMVRKLGGR